MEKWNIIFFSDNGKTQVKTELAKKSKWKQHFLKIENSHIYVCL